MPYVPVTWQDGVTPTNAANLNQMEDGIEALDALPKIPTPLVESNWLTVAGGALVWAPAPAGGGVAYENDWAAGTVYDAGDVVKHNGVEYLAVNPSTGQTPPPASPASVPLVTALPGSPVDGQEVILVDVIGAATYAWRLRYVQARATNKWIFVGGSEKIVEIATPETTASAAYADLATDGPAFTLPVTGDYDIEGEANMQAGTANQTYRVGIHANAVEILEIPTYLVATGIATVRAKGGKTLLGAVAGHIVKLRYRVTGGTGTFSMRRLSVRPLAVGG